MTNNSNDRLSQIEALIESNALAIEALSANTAEYQRDRAQMYQLMSDLAQTQADNTREMYRLMGNLDRRQGEIVEILKRLTQPENNQ